MKPEFKQLNEIDCSEYIALNTNPLARQVRFREAPCG